MTERVTITDPAEIDALIEGYRRHARGVTRYPLGTGKRYVITIAEVKDIDKAVADSEAGTLDVSNIERVVLLMDYTTPSTIPDGTKMAAIVNTRIELTKTPEPEPEVPEE